MKAIRHWQFCRVGRWYFELFRRVVHYTHTADTSSRPAAAAHRSQRLALLGDHVWRCSRLSGDAFSPRFDSVPTPTRLSSSLNISATQYSTANEYISGNKHEQNCASIDLLNFQLGANITAFCVAKAYLAKIKLETMELL